MDEIRELGGKICIDKPGSSFQSIKQLNSFFGYMPENIPGCITLMYLTFC